MISAQIFNIEVNKQREITLTPSGQSLEQSPLSTDDDTEARELDKLFSVCSMSIIVTYSAVSNRKRVKLEQKIDSYDLQSKQKN